MSPDGKIKAVPIQTRSFSIGRSNRNDLIVDDDRASRVHARIEYDGRIFRITDQNSSNGTYLDGTKLLAAVAQDWPADRPLRIGRHHFRLIPGNVGVAPNDPNAQRNHNQDARAQVPPNSLRLDGTIPQQSKPSPLGADSAGDIHLNVEPTEISVSPGGEALLNVEIRNDSEEVVQYQIRTVGVPPEWVTIRPSEVELMPSHRKNAQVLLRLPQSTNTKAGRYRVEVEAVGKAGAPSPILRAKTRLNISAFGQFTSELRQNQAPVKTPLAISVTNNRNQVERFTLSCWDDANELTFTVAQSEIEIPPGRTAIFQFTAQPRRRKWVGGAKQHAFQAKITSQAGQNETHRGTFTSRGKIPPWVPPTLLTIGLAVAGAGLGFYRYQQAQFATATAVAIANATSTATADLATVSALGTREAGTATAAANSTATAVAIARTTAEWLPKDDDRDGLTNEYELDNDLLPTNRDTDNDGLSDGDEISIYSTNPLVDDSDRDGWLDGEEKEKSTDPLDEDTDDDGIDDNIDPDPLQLPTPTPDYEATAAFFATQTAIAINREQAALDREATAAAATTTREFIATATQEAKETLAAINQSNRDQTATAEARNQSGTQTAEAQNQSATQTAAAIAGGETATAAVQNRDATNTAISATATAQATPVPKNLNFDILNRFCRDNGYDEAENDGVNGAFGWYCSGDIGTSNLLSQENFNYVCQQQYGGNSRAVAQDVRAPYSWTCVDN
jgi:hypothetical protein